MEPARDVRLRVAKEQTCRRSELSGPRRGWEWEEIGGKMECPFNPFYSMCNEAVMLVERRHVT